MARAQSPLTLSPQTGLLHRAGAALRPPVTPATVLHSGSEYQCWDAPDRTFLHQVFGCPNFQWPPASRGFSSAAQDAYVPLVSFLPLSRFCIYPRQPPPHSAVSRAPALPVRGATQKLWRRSSLNACPACYSARPCCSLPPPTPSLRLVKPHTLCLLLGALDSSPPVPCSPCWSADLPS